MRTHQFGAVALVTISGARAARPGNAAMRGRLTELMFVEIVRECRHALPQARAAVRPRSRLNPALLMGAVAGAGQHTASMRAAQKEAPSAVPGIGYPVPLAIATISLSVVGYFFALFL